MKNRIKDKIVDIESYLSELIDIAPQNFKNYIHDFKTKAACERYFEKIIEAIVDLAFLVIKDNSFNLPEEDKRAFDILAEEEVISKKLAGKLKDAKGMRNIIAHEYGKVDDRIVFESIVEDLEKDAKEFINIIKKIYTRSTK